jgi:protein farnesyltransferase subunit beta
MEVPLRPAAQAPSSQLEELLDPSARIEELSDTDNEYEDMGNATPEEQANIQYLESVRMPIRDKYETETSQVENKTHEVILPFLEGNPDDLTLNAYGIPKLQREQHAAVLKKFLGDYPAPYAAMDAARPWMVYWGLQSMTSLGLDIHPLQKRYVILVFRPSPHGYFPYSILAWCINLSDI